MLTKDLIGSDLDWHVANIEKMPVKIIDGKCIFVGRVDTWANPGSLKGILTGQPFNPSTRHGIGGLIMDREFIGTAKWIGQDEWTAFAPGALRAWSLRCAVSLCITGGGECPRWTQMVPTLKCKSTKMALWFLP